MKQPWLTTRAAWLLVVLFTLLMGAGASRASTINPTGGIDLVYSAGNVGMKDGANFERFISRILTADTVGGGASVAERYGVTVAGNSIEVAATRSIGAAPIIAAAAAAFATGVEIAAPINVALGHTDVDFGPIRCVATLTGWQCRETVDPTISTQMCLAAGSFAGQGGEICAPTITALRDLAVTKYQNYYNSQPACVATTKYVVGPGAIYGSNSFGMQIRCPPGPFSGDNIFTGGPKAVSSCAATIDALNPNWSVAAGAPWVDGKCPTGRYNPANEITVQPKLLERMTAAIAKEVLDKTLAKPHPVPGATERTVTGPASKVGTSTTTTTTTTTGTPPVPTTKTETKTPTTYYSYTGDTITYNTTITTTTNNGGDTTTTTEDGADAPDPKDPCATNPDRAGCSKLGSPSTDKPTWQEKPIPFSPESLGLAASCPAPWTYRFRATDLTMSYAPLCDTAPVIRPGLLAMTALGCLIFIFKATS